MIRIIAILSCFLLSHSTWADYERNKAVAVQQVLFGKVESVRNISQQDLVRDKNQGWKVFGGALIGGAIGSQFGDGSGQVAATILGSLIGASVSDNRNPKYHQLTTHLVELMIKTESKGLFMVVQDLDQHMRFQPNDQIRLIYLANGSVRVDKAY
jgi:outer membrane lipoprotein SlyB